jgi:hypothetical protein
LPTAIVVAGVVTLVVGAAMILLGMVRTITSQSRAEALRQAVATSIAGSGIGALGLALLILGTGTNDLIGWLAGGIAGVVGVRLLLRAASIWRSPR